ncbi:hypothetical protein CPC08DRAFT_731593, partial [Agrocybe pediades]
VQRRAKETQAKPNGLAGIREKVVKDLYAQLPQAFRDTFEAKAKEEHEETLRAWKAELEGPISTKPEDRQRCIEGLVRFAQPILDVICEATGWKATLIVGGPEPAHNGQLNIVSIHSGKTMGDIPMTFGRSERQEFKQNVVPVFGKFLKKCYTPAECRSRALGSQEGYQPLDDEELESAGADLDNIQMDMEMPGTALTRETASLSPGDNPKTSSATLNPTISSTAPALPQEVSTPPPPPAQPTPAPSCPPSPLASPPPPSAPPTPSPPSPPSAAVPPRSSSAVPTPVPSLPPSPGLDTVTNPLTGPPVPDEEQHPVVSQPLPSRGQKRKSRQPLDSNTQSGNQGSSQTSDLDTAPMPEKRRKVTKKSAAREVMTPLAPSMSDKIPWLKKSLQLLQSKDLGPRWTILLEDWQKFEQLHGFSGDLKLKATSRPSIIGDWIQRARSVSWDPPIPNVAQFGGQMSTWWTALQPSWRLDGNGELDFTLTNGNWDCLRAPGQNGLLSVIAGLFFWGVKCQNAKKSATQEHWARMVDDFIVVCNGLIAGK